MSKYLVEKTIKVSIYLLVVYLSPNLQYFSIAPFSLTSGHLKNTASGNLEDKSTAVAPTWSVSLLSISFFFFEEKSWSF